MQKQRDMPLQPFVALRVPKLFNLRTDPYERADVTSNEYYAWVLKNAYLVLSSKGERPLPVRVLLDGRPIRASQAGADVHGGVVTVRRQRLYSLVSLPGDERHHLALRFAPGVSGYAFTFG